MFYIKTLSFINSSTKWFNPLWLSKYSGFEIYPLSHSINVAICTSNGYWCWNENGYWEKCDKPVFYEPSFIRDRIIHLAPGNIKFQSNQDYKGNIRLGYYLEGSMLDYLINFAIPSYIKDTGISLVRWVETLEGEFQIDIPEQLDLNRIKNIQIFNFGGHKNQLGCVSQELKSIVFPEALHKGDGRLLFGYDIDIITAVDKETYQISSLPCICIVPMMGANNKYDLSGYSETIQSGEGLLLQSVSTWQMNQIIEIAVFADSVEESRSVSLQIMNQITSHGTIYLPPFDCWVYIKPNSEIEAEKRYGNIKGNVRTCKFELMISNLLEG